MSTPKIVIARPRTGLKAGLVAGLAFVIAISAFALYRYTQTSTVSGFERTRAELDRLREDKSELARELRAARSEISRLKDDVAYAERSTEIDTQSCETVRASLDGMQKEVTDLREQLGFYRGIVAPEFSRAGVRIYDLSLSKGETVNSWRYELVLVQSVRRERRIGGKVRLAVEGIQNRERVTMRLEELAIGQAESLEFSFKFFEDFSGEFVLPVGFQPAFMRVFLNTDVDGAPEVKQEFDWTKIVKG